MYIGQLIENLCCYGWPEGRVLTDQEKKDVVSFALGFEECNESRDELQAMNDKDLVRAAYFAMAQYASGQL